MRSRVTVSPAPSRVPSLEPVNNFATSRPVKPATPPRAKLKDYGESSGGYRILVFHCPGCERDHPFAVAAGELKDVAHPIWKWNGSFTAPTFAPSLVCDRDTPERRCHLTMTDGRIQFLQDSWHKLAGQMVDVPDWEE